MSDRRQRLPIGAALIAIIGGILFFDTTHRLPVMAPGLLLLLALQALREFFRMSEVAAEARLSRVALTLGGVMVAAPALLHHAGAPTDVLLLLGAELPVVLLVLALTLMVPRWTSGVEAADLRRLAMALFGLLLVALPMALLMETLFRCAQGLAWAALVILGCKLNDIGGYLVGSSLPPGRRHALTPGLSPNKTIEGALGGLLFCILGTWGLREGLGAPIAAIPLLPFLSFALVLGVAAQLSDVLESLVKRACGVKDSGALLPAFGGALDMVDSFILGAPVGYAFGILWLT